MSTHAFLTDEDSWIVSLTNNVLSYALVVIPTALVVRHYEKHPELLAGPGIQTAMLRKFILGIEIVSQDLEGATKVPEVTVAGNSAAEESTLLTRFLKVSFYAGGLQASYLVWGVLQEQIMTQDYQSGDEVIHFRNSQYLVLLNRALALIVAMLIITCNKHQKPDHAPLYKYSFSSMANVMSSWCQYEALKYVGFPTQVLAKACKILPVMVMGKIVQQKTYPLYEYGLSTLMSIGVALFMFAKADEKEAKHHVSSEETAQGLLVTTSGAALLIGYMVFDSFTSNYQSLLFKTYKMDSYQMMYGTNLFSTFFTLWTLVQQGTFMSCITFTTTYPLFAWHSLLLSITSATGQIFIFKTIHIYGALVFAIIMTTRQVLSILLSALVFHHSFTLQAWCGVGLVFVAMFARIYVESGEKKPRGSK